MQTVNIHEAKTHLSRLVERAAQGESFIIAKSGKPMVQVIPLTAVEAKKPQRLGFMLGMGKIPDDFDTLYAKDIEDMFNQGKLFP